MLGHRACPGYKFDRMILNCAFAHWYVGELIVNGGFSEAGDNLAALKDYEEIAGNTVSA